MVPERRLYPWSKVVREKKGMHMNAPRYFDKKKMNKKQKEE